jgi:hypothetical protein
MPAKGEQSVPVFNPFKPRKLSRFFSDLEVLFNRAKLTYQTEMKKTTVYYVDFETEQIWKTFPEFSTIGKTYINFRDAGGVWAGTDPQLGRRWAELVVTDND